MDGLSGRIGEGQAKENLGELEPRAVRCGKGEVASGFWLDGAENVGRSATFVFVVSPGFPTRRRR